MGSVIDDSTTATFGSFPSTPLRLQRSLPSSPSLGEGEDAETLVTSRKTVSLSEDSWTQLPCLRTASNYRHMESTPEMRVVWVGNSLVIGTDRQSTTVVANMMSAKVSRRSNVLFISPIHGIRPNFSAYRFRVIQFSFRNHRSFRPLTGE
jgi:hypothetical protein